MALVQNLRLDQTNLVDGFILGYVNAYCCNAGAVGDIVAQTGAIPYLTWITLNGVNPADIGGGTQTQGTMGGYVYRIGSGGTPANPFKTYQDTTLISGTALLQQPIRHNSNNTADDVVWGVYLPQTDPDFGPAGSVGRIMGFGATVEDGSSVSGNDPNSIVAIEALGNLLYRLGTQWYPFNGPKFEENYNASLYGSTGLFAGGGFLSYSNINGTWLVYPGA
jgi:hypothetical protein